MVVKNQGVPRIDRAAVLSQGPASERHSTDLKESPAGTPFDPQRSALIPRGTTIDSDQSGFI